MIRSRYLIPILILASLHLAGCSGHGAATPDMMSDTLPHMTPDYSGAPGSATQHRAAALPHRHPADAYQASIALSGSGAPRDCRQQLRRRDPDPGKEWSSLLDRAAGSSVEITTATRTDGRWTAYPAMTVDIDTARLDDWLVYRLIYPGYELWSDMGIYQRCPATFEQQALLEKQRCRAAVHELPQLRSCRPVCHDAPCARAQGRHCSHASRQGAGEDQARCRRHSSWRRLPSLAPFGALHSLCRR